MKRFFKKTVGLQLATAAVLLSFGFQSAQALPSFARQTGLTCQACHTAFPQLTPFGRHFKLLGYTMSNERQMQSKELQENYFPPLSAMMQISYTKWKKAPTAGDQNKSTQFPQQLSLFYAGRISDNLGTFLQITYDQGDHFTMDNTDVRAVKQTQLNGKPLVLGLTLNNGPGIQDLWNSTPAWGFPFSGSEDAPAPAADVQIDGLGQQVAGLGVYGMYDSSLYGEVSLYRSAQVGTTVLGSGSSGVIKGLAPYWRVAYERDWGVNSLEVGAYGMDMKMYQAGATGGPTNHFTDTALDAQYQYLAGDNTLTVDTTYIHEKQKWSAASGNNASDKLNVFHLNGTYYYKRMYGGSLGYFRTSGTADTAQYGTTNAYGDATGGKPDSSGFVAQVNYMPWLNTRFALQYTAYNKVDGTSTDAKNNNTLYLLAWFMW